MCCAGQLHKTGNYQDFLKVFMKVLSKYHLNVKLVVPVPLVGLNKFGFPG